MSGNEIFERDFDELESGAAFKTAGRTITESDLVSFAALTGDRHPLHTDARWAAASPFGERVAHGMLVLSYALGLVPFDPGRALALRGLDHVVFKRPAHIGDTIRVEGRVESVEPLDAATGLVTCGWKVLNERDETIARAKLKLLWRRDSDREPARHQPDRRGREAEQARHQPDRRGGEAEQAIGTDAGQVEVYL